MIVTEISLCYYNFMEVFNRQLALEMVGDEEELLEMLEVSFVNDKKFKRDVLIDLENRNPMEAAAYVHSFKGAARQIAAERTALAGQNLEDVLRGKKEGNLIQLNEAFERELFIAIEEIRKDLEGL